MQDLVVYTDGSDIKDLAREWIHRKSRYDHYGYEDIATERDRERQTDRQRQRQRDTDTDRQTDKQTDRQHIYYLIRLAQ